MSQFEGDGEAYGDEGGDEEVDEAEMMKALELNRQLKAMMEQMSEQEMAQMMEMQQAQAQSKQPPPRQGGGGGGGGPSVRGAGGGGKRSDGAPSIMGPDGPGMVSRRPKNNYTMSDEEMNRVARDNNHLLQRMVDIHKSGVQRKGGGFSFNEKYYDDSSSRHVSSHSINRRKATDKISQENAKFAQRLNSVRASVPSGPGAGRSGGGSGGGGIRSTGYAHVSAGIGPLARKNELAARAPRPPRLEHPEMQF